MFTYSAEGSENRHWIAAGNQGILNKKTCSNYDQKLILARMELNREREEG